MTLKYRPEIDGLRAIAVLPVILFHAGFSTFSGGFIGVDVFFVISGFLITSIIVTDVDAGTFSFLAFYERRARRILPALFLVIICCMPFAWAWMLPQELKAFSTSVISVSLFASNFLFWRQSGYFDTASELKPLLHTWSLAVEEQYYIIFPIVILLLWRLGRQRVIASLALVAVASLLLSEWSWRHAPDANFYLLPTRVWELMAGAVCSFATLTPRPGRDNALSSLGLAAIVFSVLWFDETTPFPSIYAAVPVAGTCLVLLFATSGTIVCRLLSTRSLVGTGLISYSAYLWHQPLFAFGRIRSLTEPSGALMLSLCAAALGLAYLSWRFVERPIRSRHGMVLPGRRSAFTAFALVAALLVCTGLAGLWMKGFPQRLPADAAAMLKYSDDRNPRSDECISKPASHIPPPASCIYGDASHVGVAMLGDSHANALANELGRAFLTAGAGFRELTNSGCPPVDGYRRRQRKKFYDCSAYHRDAVAYLSGHPEITTVVVFSRWSYYVEFERFDNGEGGQELGEAGAVALDGVDMADKSAVRSKIGSLYQDSIRQLLGMGKNVVIVYPQPDVGWDVPSYLTKSVYYGTAVARPLSTRYDVFSDRSRFAYSQLDAIKSDMLIRIKPEAIFCNTLVKGRCAAEDGSVPFYFDDNHVNSVGAAMLAREIVSAMKAKGWL